MNKQDKAIGYIKYDNGSEITQEFKSWLAAKRWFNKKQRTVFNYTELKISKV